MELVTSTEFAVRCRAVVAPMTMVFSVSDEKLLDKIKVGDKVRFTATGDGGKFTVTDLQPDK